MFHRGKSAGIYESTYSVGALNTGTDTIAGFSSRGPVTADGSNRIKPDVSAPGTNTRSSTNDSDSSYAAFSGTSMATPHIAGAMALLWNAIPSLRHQLDGQSRRIEQLGCAYRFHPVRRRRPAE